MKITKTILKRIIREETERTLKEQEETSLVDQPVFSDVPEEKRGDLEQLDKILTFLLSAHEAARIDRRLQGKIQEAIDELQAKMGEDFLGV